MTTDVDALRTAEDVQALARSLYGVERFEPRAGVVHPTACVVDATGVYRTLLIEDDTPKSAHDLFALYLARARADAIVTTGAILRAEPDVRYALDSSPVGEALQRYRREVLDKASPPRLVVMSRRGLSAEHPALVELPEVQWWRDGRAEELTASLQNDGLGTVVVEAGPSTTASLHQADAVDELLLTTFVGDVPGGLVGASPFDEGSLKTRLVDVAPEHCLDEPSGRWCFRRLRRGDHSKV